LVAKYFNITLQDRFETCPYNKNNSIFTISHSPKQPPRKGRRFNMNTRIITLTAIIAITLALTACEEKKSTTAESGNTFTDSRDGKAYKTVKIGEQVWMAENLNYKTPEGSECYDNKEANCSKYGRLYDWNTAMKACPSGWHLPSRGECVALNATVGDDNGKKLKAKSGWNGNGNGTDDYGFSALPGGSGYSDNGNDNFWAIGTNGAWWTTEESNTDHEGNSSDNAYNLDIYYESNLLDSRNNSKSMGYSVRCIKD
jgi:uncharacterized protein (TIGR02145 family)